MSCDPEDLGWVYDPAGSPDPDRDDCVVRAIAIATGQTYGDVLAKVEEHCPGDPDDGGFHDVDELMAHLGWQWCAFDVPLAGLRVRDSAFIVDLGHHVFAVIGGEIHDTTDPGPWADDVIQGIWLPPTP